MMTHPLHILVVEDEEDDALLILRLLDKEGFDFTHRRVQEGPEMESALMNESWDLILCDFRLPKFSGNDALELFKKSGTDIPFILLSGTVGEEIAVEMMKAGAHDYIMKDHLLQLGPAIRRALSDAEVRRQNRKAMEDLRIAKERAEQSDHIRSTLLSNMSHEFRTPLTGILGYAQVIMEEEVDPSVRNSAIKIFNSGKRLMKTLDSIVLLSQMESGIKPGCTEFDLHALLDDSIRGAKDFFHYKNLPVEKEFNGPFLVYSDRDLVQTACASILDNAIKFSRKGTIRVRSLKRGTDDVPLAGFTIEDEGIGISEENLERIFDAFRQVSEGYSRHYEGIGLGLSITRRISLILGGTIQVESTPGKGSAFTFLFPANPAGEKIVLPASSLTPATPDFRSDQRTGKPKVLIVEDHESNAELACLYLSKNFQTEVAYRGEDAVSMAEHNRYDMVLMDINLGPGIDGVEAMHAIRKLDSYTTTPVIALTGYTQFGDRERLISEGFNGYIAKPFEKATLVNSLNSILA